MMTDRHAWNVKNKTKSRGLASVEIAKDRVQGNCISLIL